MAEPYMPKSAKPMQAKSWMPKSARPITAEEPGFIDRVGAHVDRRLAGGMAYMDKANQGIISRPEAIAGAFSEGANILNDTAGEVLSSVTPDFVKDAAKSGIAYLADTDIGRRVRGGARTVADAYGDFAEKNPRAATNLATAGRLANAAIGVLPISKGAETVARPAAKIAVEGAKLPVVAGKAAIRGGGLIKTGATARSTDELSSVAQGFKDQAQTSYKRSRALGALFTPQKSKGIVYQVNSAIGGGGRLNPKLHGDTLSVSRQMSQEAKKVGQLDLEGLEQYRQLFSDVVKRNTDIATGMNDDARRASLAIDAIDDVVMGAGKKDLSLGSTEAIDAMKEGRRTWAKMRSFEAVSDVLDKAGGDPNRIKAGFTRLSQNNKRMRGFTKEERAAIKEAARSTVPEKLFRALGTFGIDLGTDTGLKRIALPTIAGGLSTAFGGLGTGGLTTAAATGAQQAYKYLARGKGENVLRQIERR